MGSAGEGRAVAPGEAVSSRCGGDRGVAVALVNLDLGQHIARVAVKQWVGPRSAAGSHTSAKVSALVDAARRHGGRRPDRCSD
jgi:hypothetical protein